MCGEVHACMLYGRGLNKPTCIRLLTATTRPALSPPFSRGMGINPTPQSALAIWGPYVFTLLFLTFGMRGLEPLKRYLYDRQKRRKQVTCRRTKDDGRLKTEGPRRQCGVAVVV